MRGLSNLIMGLAIVLGAATMAWGQQVTAAITGTVVDPGGAPITGATVTATDTERGTVSSTKTNDAGVFNLQRVPVGTYDVRATATGFQTAVNPPLTLVLNQTARLDFKMRVGSVTETVEVSGTPPELQTETTQVSTLIDNKTVNDIPLATRNYVELTLLAPGSVTPDNSTFNNGDNTVSGGRPYINGNREQANNFLLDGMDNNQVSDNLLGYTPAPDAIQEFNLITSDAPAEFGNFQGGIVSATIKSGTNRFHGDVWEYFRNDVLNANQWENKFGGPGNELPKPKLRWNMFGGSVGGPIVKNKLFFFADYQGQRFDHPSSSSFITVFTGPERNGDFSGICTAGFVNGLCTNSAQQLKNPLTGVAFPNNQIPTSLQNAVAKNLFASQFYPTPINTQPINNAVNTTAQSFDANQGDIKIDWIARAKDRISGRYSQGYQSNPLTNSVLILGNSTSDAPTHNLVAQWTHTFSNNLLNELRLGGNWITVDTGVSFANSLGNLGTTLGIANANNVGPGLLGLDFGGGQPSGPNAGTITNIGNSVVHQHFATTVTQFDDGLVYNRGKHVFKFGYQMWNYRINVFYSGNNGEYGSIIFDGGFSGNAGSDFFLGYPSATGQGIPPSNRWHQRNWTFAGYAQDDWRVTANLTLNLGLRYEAHTPWWELNNRQSNFGLISGQLELAGVNGNSRALYNGTYGLPDFQPRIGFAWSPARYDGRTVIRGAYTISSYLEGTGTNLRLPLNPPFTPPEITNTYSGPNVIPTVTTNQGVISNPQDPFVGATLRVWDPNVQPAMDQQWNLTFQQQLAKNLTLQMGYVGQHGTHLMVPTPYAQKQLNPAGTVSPSFYFSGNPTLINEIGTISGTSSTGYMSYNAMQVVLQQQHPSHGLQGQVAYTWSHCLTNNSGYYGTWGSATQATPASPYYQNLYAPNADYADCYYDTHNVLSAYATYDLPFGKGKKFGGNMNSVANAVVGNWQASAIVSIHSGFPLAVYGTDESGTGSRGPRPNCTGRNQVFGRKPAFDSSGNFLGYDWMSIAGYANPAPGTFGNCPAQGPDFGPGYTDTDLSFMKNFHFTESMYLQFRADFLNAFNNVQLGHPNTNYDPTSTSFGLVNTSQPARNIQFALKFYF